MFSCDVPLSKTFGFRGYSVFHERFRRVLVAHSGYNELTNPDQTLVLGSGAPKAIALCSVKAEQCHGGMEQLQFLMGDRAGHQTDRSVYSQTIWHRQGDSLHENDQAFLDGITSVRHFQQNMLHKSTQLHV